MLPGPDDPSWHGSDDSPRYNAESGSWTTGERRPSGGTGGRRGRDQAPQVRGRWPGLEPHDGVTAGYRPRRDTAPAPPGHGFEALATADYRGRPLATVPRPAPPDTFGQVTAVIPRTIPAGVIVGGRRGALTGLVEPDPYRYPGPPERLDRPRDDEAGEGGHEAADQRYWVTASWTITWYAIPLALTAGWMLVGAEGGRRASALAALAGGLPMAAASLLISLLVAGMLRWAGRTWRPMWVGFAAAAVGAGIATLVFSAITGQSPG